VDTDQLAAFLRVVRESSFTRAALSLGIGQPAVSARIHALETAIGGPLFTRGRKIALTLLGESFLPYARRATEVLGEGVEAARLARSGQRGRITMASLGSLAGGLVGPAMAAVVKAHPAIEWRMRSGDHELVLGLLWDGLVELGVIAWPSPEAIAGDLMRLFVLREPVDLVAAPGHVLAATRRGTRIGRDEVAKLARPLLRLRWWRTYHPEVTRLTDRAASTVEAPMETARHLVMRGGAVGFFPRTYIAEDLEAGRLVAIPVHDLAPVWRDSALVRRARGAPPSAAVAAMIEALRAQADRLGAVRGARSRAISG
jgi:DNA-binding transcriptional LysR family regulator